MINDDRVIEISEDLACRLVDEDVFIVSLKTGKYYSLNAFAMAIWKKITGRDSSVEAIVDWAGKKFPAVPADDIRSDINDFLKDLEGQGLIMILSAKDKTASGKNKDRIRQAGTDKSKGIDVYMKPQLINYENLQGTEQGRKVYACPVHVDYFSEWDLCAL